MNTKATQPQTSKEPTELAKIFRQCKRALLYAAIFSLCMNFMLLLLPIYSLQVLDRVMSSHSIDTLIVLTFICVVAFAFFGIFMLIRSFILQGIVEWLDNKLAPLLLQIAIVKSSLGALPSAGQYQRDLMMIKNFINSGVAILLDAPWSIIFIFVIYMINPILGFLAVCGAVILIAFGVINEMATKKPIEQSQENAIQSTHLADVASRNAEAIEAMGMMQNILRNWTKHNDVGLDLQNIASKRSHIIQSISKSIRMIIQIGVIGIGGYLTLQNEMTVGGMIACSILVARALAPFEGAINIWKSLVGARESYHRLDHVISNVPKMRGDMALPKPTGKLTVENLYFQPPGGPPIIKNVNFSLEPGESLGIIGPSAAGKSTLAKLIMGILPPTHGTVRLDGAETFKWNRDDFGQYVGYMPQQVDLFNGTIRDNIARMDPEIDDEKVITAAKFAGAHEMILKLPNGYETEYNFGNQGLSPGQRQRIGLARALYTHPTFVVLDEPNSNLDGEGERALLGTMKRMKQAGMSIVIVAHRPSIVGTVDKILMLRGGVIESFGPRDEVLKKYTTPQKAAPQQEKVSSG